MANISAIDTLEAIYNDITVNKGNNHLVLGERLIMSAQK
jgi:hypothetical protein